MDFKFTEEQELLVASVRELLTREMPESLVAEYDDKQEFPWEVWKKVAQAGLGGLGVPEEYGGTPVDVVTLCLVAEEINKVTSALPFTSNMMNIHNLLDFGTEKQKSELIPKLMTGEILIGFAITEPQAGSDTSALKTSYKKVDGGYLINGQKMYTTLAHVANYVMLVCRDPEVENPYKAMTMFLLPMDTKGVRVNRLHKFGNLMTGTNEVFLDEVFLPDDALFGQEHAAFMQMMKHFEVERLVIGAGSLGAAQTAFQDACIYANKRVQFGQPVGKFQLVQEKIVSMAIKLENMHNMVYKCAWKVDQGQSTRIDANLVKLYCAQACFEVCDDAMQVLGGVGLMMDHRIQRLWRDARGSRIFGGTDQVMIHSTGPQILKLYADGAPK